jgi:hypothetical protein
MGESARRKKKGLYPAQTGVKKKQNLIDDYESPNSDSESTKKTIVMYNYNTTFSGIENRPLDFLSLNSIEKVIQVVKDGYQQLGKGILLNLENKLFYAPAEAGIYSVKQIKSMPQGVIQTLQIFVDQYDPEDSFIFLSFDGTGIGLDVSYFSTFEK